MSKRSEKVAEIIDNLRRVFQVVNEQSKKAEHETGLTGPQLWAIKTIAQEAPIMVSDIARRMYLHKATVVGILDRLEKQRLVVRIRSTEDRRVVRVELTAQGRALVKKSPEVAQGLLVSGLEKLSSNKLESIARALDQMAEILGAQNIPPQLILSPEVNKPVKTAAMIQGKTTVRRRSATRKP
ncbi:MAG TPA: MarR family transcriptional regulator [Nitrospirota bacterium]|nr:MarR family transcriptional regulator [Nitrospirota bacterium]